MVWVTDLWFGDPRMPSLFPPSRGLVWYDARARGLSWALRSETCSEYHPSIIQLNIVQGSRVPRPPLELLSKCLLAQFSRNPEKLIQHRSEKHPSIVRFYSTDLLWALRHLETLWSRFGWNGWMIVDVDVGGRMCTDWDLMTSVTVVKDPPRRCWGKS